MNEMIMGPNFHTLANIFLFFNSSGLPSSETLGFPTLASSLPSSTGNSRLLTEAVYLADSANLARSCAAPKLAAHPTPSHRQSSLHFVPFGLPRIELGLQDPQPCVLPLYDSPPSSLFISFSLGLLGIEPSLHAPEACVLPVYYSPLKTNRSKERGCRHVCFVRPEGIEPSASPV